MKTIKLSHVLFSLALIAALALAVIPVPVFALSASATAPASGTSLTASGGLVCHSVVVWHHGHRTVVRRCHRVGTSAS